MILATFVSKLLQNLLLVTKFNTFEIKHVHNVYICKHFETQI